MFGGAIDASRRDPNFFLQARGPDASASLAAKRTWGSGHGEYAGEEGGIPEQANRVVSILAL